MKNIHLIPTEKPSRLGRFIDTNNLFIRVSSDIPRGENVKIYITSDEEIKEGDWIKWGEAIYKANKKYTPPFKKIILTTDSDLIKDGVQAIDDEFIDWFVNNSNCEEIGVKKYENGKYWTYEIIIPTLGQKLENIVSKQPSKFWEESDKRVKERETLEEVAYKLFSTMPSEISTSTAKSKALELAKWLQERSYSEEEVGELVYNIIGQYGKHYGMMIDGAKINELFKQFKKK